MGWVEERHSTARPDRHIPCEARVMVPVEQGPFLNSALAASGAKEQSSNMHPPADPMAPLPGFDTPTRRLGRGAYVVVTGAVILARFIAALAVRHVFFSPDWRLHGEKQARLVQVDQWNGLRIAAGKTSCSSTTTKRPTCATSAVDSSRARPCPTRRGSSCPHPPATRGGVTETASCGPALLQRTSRRACSSSAQTGLNDGHGSAADARDG